MRRCLHCHHDTKHWKPSDHNSEEPPLKWRRWTWPNQIACTQLTTESIITLWPTLMSHPVLDHVMLWFVMVHTGQTIPLITPFQVSQLSPVSVDVPLRTTKCLGSILSGPPRDSKKARNTKLLFLCTNKSQSTPLSNALSPRVCESLLDQTGAITLPLHPQQQSCQGWKDGWYQGLWKWHLPFHGLSFYPIDLIS